jgi:hypothetical protein
MANISCSASDSLVATIYMTGGDQAGASEWCACGGAGECSVQFTGLGYGEYLLGIGTPDTTYLATQGAQGFVQQLGYYGGDSLAQNVDTAEPINVSSGQPQASVEFALENR